MLLGGDLYEQEENFFNLVESRAENTVEEWVKLLKCPIIRIDGTRSIEENTNLIMEKLLLNLNNPVKSVSLSHEGGNNYAIY